MHVNESDEEHMQSFAASLQECLQELLETFCNKENKELKDEVYEL